MIRKYIAPLTAFLLSCGLEPEEASQPKFVMPTAVCGDGILNRGEECDTGDQLDEHDNCSFECKLEYCGDGVVQGNFEECDDGNTASGDGCDTTCNAEHDELPRLPLGMIEMPHEKFTIYTLPELEPIARVFQENIDDLVPEVERILGRQMEPVDHNIIMLYGGSNSFADAQGHTININPPLEHYDVLLERLANPDEREGIVDYLNMVFKHELTHILIGTDTGAPSWVHEGLATYVGGQDWCLEDGIEAYSSVLGEFGIYPYPRLDESGDALLPDLNKNYRVGACVWNYLAEHENIPTIINALYDSIRQHTYAGDDTTFVNGLPLLHTDFYNDVLVPNVSAETVVALDELFGINARTLE